MKLAPCRRSVRSHARIIEDDISKDPIDGNPRDSNVAHVEGEGGERP
jgi:hypothetical protein